MRYCRFTLPVSYISIFYLSLFLSIYAHGHTQDTRTTEALIKSSLSALEALSETLSLGLKDVSQLKKEMIVTRAAVRDGSEFKALKESLTALQGKVQSLCDEPLGLKSQVPFSHSLSLSPSLPLSFFLSLSLARSLARSRARALSLSLQIVFSISLVHTHTVR